jgi:hypothetical protein
MRVPASTSDFLQNIEQAVTSAKNAIARAQQNQKKYYDQRRSELTLSVGDSVFIEKYGLPPDRRGSKISPQRIGPFRIKKQISPVAYQLDIPATYKFHSVFHVSFLTPVRPYRQAEPEFIKDTRVHSGQRQFFVHFKGSNAREDRWLPADEIQQHYPAVYLDFIRRAAVGALFSLSTSTIHLRFL